MRRLLTCLLASATVALPGVLVPTQSAGAAPEQVDLELLVDLNDSSDGSNPRDFVRMGSLVFFQAEDDELGQELWVYDDVTGTATIVDIRPGALGSSPTPGVAHDGLLYFSARRDDVERELFVSDGTVAGTTLLKDLHPTDDGSPRDFTVFDGDVFFVATDAVSEDELWRTDGTEAGTVRVSDIASGGDADVDDLTPVEVSPGQHVLFFTADDGVTGNELHRHRPGAVPDFDVVDLSPGPDSSDPSDLVAANSKLALIADTSGTRYLHLVSGAAVPTVDEKPSSLPANDLAVADAGIFVSTRDSSVVPTALALEYLPAGGSLAVVKTIGAFDMVAIGSSVVFDGRADAGEGGIEPWVSDGTPGGTEQLVDLTPGGDSGNVYVKASGTPGELLVRATTPSGIQIYTTDGTAGGTVRITDPTAGEASNIPTAMLATQDGTILMSFGPTPDDVELWSSDGTADSASKVLEINANTLGSNPEYFVEMGGVTYFVADTEEHGEELRRVNGDDSVSLVADIAPGSEGSNIDEMVATDSMLYFEADDDTAGDEIWRSDGTLAGTEIVTDFALPGTSERYDLYAGDTLVYVVVDGDVLHAIDGLTVTELSPFLRDMWVIGDSAIFEAPDGDLRITDGTVAGTKVLPDEIPALASVTLGDPVVHEGVAYFWGSDNAVWTSDGTVAGTMRSSIVDVEDDDHDVQGIHVGPSGIYLQVEDSDVVRAELWHSPDVDTAAVPVAVSGVVDEEVWQGPVVDAGDSVFFNVSVNGDSDLETLIVTDGATATRVPLATPDRVDSYETTVHDGRAFWLLETDTEKRELWVSDGTADGSGRILAFDTGSSAGNWPAFIGDRFYIDVNTSELGSEPWFVDLPNAPEPEPEPDPESALVSLEPGRVLESRPGLETVDGVGELGRKVAAGEEIELLLAGRVGIDADAAAVVMNVTAVNPDGRGYLTIHPCGDRPVASALNFGEAGVVVGNEVIARLSGDGTVCIYASEATHLTADAVGFVPGSSPLVSLEPGRVLESRPGLETVDGVGELGRKVAAGEEIELLLAGRVGIDADAAAVVMNVTAVNPDGRGYLTIHPCGDRPVASALNFGEAGVVVGNEVIARLSGDGTVCIYASEATHLTADAVGFVPGSSPLVSLEPGRVLESRPGLETVDGVGELGRKVAAGEEIELSLAGRVGIDADAAAVVMNVTAVNPDGRGYLTIHPCGDRPVASALNFGEAGVVVGNEVIARLSGDGTVCIYASEATHLTVDAVGFVPAAT